MRERVPQKTLGDYVTIAISPLLIMALVGSLVFFLLEVLYAGQYSERLQWTLFWFVFAMVLIARIAIEQNDGRAGMYGLALGAAVFVSLQAFIEYTPDAPVASFRWAINLGLMAIIWWSAHRLVWDCTYIDDKVDDSGAGLLDAAGLEAAHTEDDEDEGPEDKDDAESPKRSKKLPIGFSGWLDRYRLYRERQDKKPHTAGVWVVYFSLAALPLFGLGQSLIPAEAADRRRYVFWLMVIYVGSGLGLLLTTSYLGLRRYLRQRKLSVPVSLTAAWMAMGATLVAAMLLVGALLPRPYGEYQLISFKPLGSEKRDASKYAMKGDSAGKGEGKASSDPKATDAKAKGGSGTQRSDKSGNSVKGNKGDSSSKGGKSSNSSKGNKSSSQGKSSGNKNRDDSSKDSKDQSDKSDEEKNKGDDKNNDDRNQKESRNTGGRSKNPEERQGKDAKDKDQDPSGDNQTQKPSPPSFQFLDKLGWLGTLLKWIVFAVIALVVIFFILRSGLRWLANFTLWARNLLNALSAWWQGLFGGSSRTNGAESEEEAQEETRRAMPFSSYSNPFHDGTVGQVSPEEIARYTFAAFEAWANDHDLPRGQQETPIEFYERVAQQTPDLAAEGKRMVGCYVRVAYAKSRLTPAALEVLEKFWTRLERAQGPDMAAKAAWEDENGP